MTCLCNIQTIRSNVLHEVVNYLVVKICWKKMTDPLIKPHFSGLNIRVQIDILIRINMEGKRYHISMHT